MTHKICQRKFGRVKGPYVISARNLAKCVGQIISAAEVLAPRYCNISRIMTRHCRMSIASASTRDKHFSLDGYCRQEIQFWQRNLKLNDKHCFLLKQPNYFVQSDASVTGCGSVITLNENTICHKMKVGGMKFELHMLPLTYSPFTLITESHWIPREQNA